MNHNLAADKIKFKFMTNGVESWHCCWIIPIAGFLNFVKFELIVRVRNVGENSLCNIFICAYIFKDNISLRTTLSRSMAVCVQQLNRDVKTYTTSEIMHSIGAHVCHPKCCLMEIKLHCMFRKQHTMQETSGTIRFFNSTWIHRMNQRPCWNPSY